MNRETTIVVCGYAGDVDQIKNAMPFYRHHECPLLILSPDNSKIGYESFPGIQHLTCWSAGQQAYIGPESLVRQKKHLELMLRFPHQWFLVNDSDSFCIAPEIPRYVYESDVLWSNVVSDEMHTRHPHEYPNGYDFPRLAFQPPYFMTRRIIQGLIDIADSVPADPKTPFIDWCMMAWAHRAGLPYAGFHDGVSCPTRNYGPGLCVMSDAVRHRGAAFLHSVKDLSVIKHLERDRKEFKRMYR